MFKLTTLTLALLAFTACGGSSTSVTSPTTVGGVTVTPTRGAMTAIIDGSAWTATAITTASYTNGILSIGGADNSNPIRSIGLAVNVTAPGTFSMATGAGNANLSIGIGPTWTANVAGGSGTIVITAISSTGATGTFLFTAVAAAGGATGTHTVTSGVFNITF